MPVRTAPEKAHLPRRNGLVPAEKVCSRYVRSLNNLPAFIELCDICHVYDNSVQPTRIFRKHKEQENLYVSTYWTKQKLLCLLYGAEEEDT